MKSQTRRTSSVIRSSAFINSWICFCLLFTFFYFAFDISYLFNMPIHFPCTKKNGIILLKSHYFIIIRLAVSSVFICNYGFSKCGNWDWWASIRKVRNTLLVIVKFNSSLQSARLLSQINVLRFAIRQSEAVSTCPAIKSLTSFGYHAVVTWPTLSTLKT